MILRVGGRWAESSVVPSGLILVGTSALSSGLLQNVPTQIGNSRSPSSNSTHTPSPTSGTNSIPRSDPPPYPTHGAAQPVTTSSPSRLGTWSFRRPSPSGPSL